MNDAEQILSNAVAWASAEPNVRSLVLVGSRAQDGWTSGGYGPKHLPVYPHAAGLDQQPLRLKTRPNERMK